MLNLLLIASDGGIVEAMHNLGVLYLNSDLLPIDFEKAQYYLTQSASQGYTQSANYLSKIPHLKKEWEALIADPEKRKDLADYAFSAAQDQYEMHYFEFALLWFKEAARLGHPQGYGMTGYMLAHGQGTPVDTEEAHKWYKKGTEVGDYLSQNNLANAYLKSPQKKELEPEIVRLATAAAEQNMPQACALLGSLYASGTGVTKDAKIALFWA